MPGKTLYTLSHHMDLLWLLEAYRRTRKDGATGVDGQTAAQYAPDLEANLQSLLNRAKTGLYRAPPVRRVLIPKGDGSQTRPIGIPTFEDKVLQRSVVMLLEPVYEEEFYPFSYGFRPGRSAHQALRALDRELARVGGGWVLDVDLKSFFDTIDHGKLRDLLRQRVTDGVVVRLVGKWLHAGVLEGGVVHRSDRGTPQGGVVSPLLANIFLHEALDTWWVKDVLPRLRGRGGLVRYADDFVMVFSRREDAERVRAALPKRMARYGLTVHPEKTRLVRFERPRGDGKGGKPESFDFLGFTYFWTRTRRGRYQFRRKTAKRRFSRALRSLNEWLRKVRHWKVSAQARGRRPQAPGSLFLLWSRGQLGLHQPVPLRGAASLAEVVEPPLATGVADVGKVQPPALQVSPPPGTASAARASAPVSEPVISRSRVREFRTPGSVGDRGAKAPRPTRHH